MTSLRFADAEALADLGTFVARARSLDADGAIRLQAHGLVLAAYVGVLPGRGLMADGAVIGLRVMPLAEPVELDTTVPLAGITDRLARSGTGAGTLEVPPTTLSAGWSAVAPPRAGWERVGEVTAEALTEAAAQGIAEVAEGAPTGAGGHAVTALRERVWSRPTATGPSVPAGGAFAAYALGFLRPGATATVLRQGRWTRISTDAGHVLLR